MTPEELKLEQERINDLVQERAIKTGLDTASLSPIWDGIADKNGYLKSSPKKVKMDSKYIEILKYQIAQFDAITSELENNGIIRSSKYWGDIGEKICEQLYSLTLCENGRQKGYDAERKGKKYQIKLHKSPKKTNISLGKKIEYDFLLLLIWEKCLNKKSERNGFRIYRFTAAEGKRLGKGKTQSFIGKKKLQGKKVLGFFDIPSTTKHLLPFEDPLPLAKN